MITTSQELHQHQNVPILKFNAIIHDFHVSISHVCDRPLPCKGNNETVNDMKTCLANRWKSREKSNKGERGPDKQLKASQIQRSTQTWWEILSTLLRDSRVCAPTPCPPLVWATQDQAREAGLNNKESKPCLLWSRKARYCLNFKQICGPKLPKATEQLFWHQWIYS